MLCYLIFCHVMLCILLLRSRIFCIMTLKPIISNMAEMAQQNPNTASKWFAEARNRPKSQPQRNHWTVGIEFWIEKAANTAPNGLGNSLYPPEFPDTTSQQSSNIALNGRTETRHSPYIAQQSPSIASKWPSISPKLTQNQPSTEPFFRWELNLSPKSHQESLKWAWKFAVSARVSGYNESTKLQHSPKWPNRSPT